MIITLKAVSLNDQALSRPITARFDVSGGTIGRADHSTLALPDPERFISRTQAEVVFVSGGFIIRNTGAANPITVSGRVLAHGETAPLREGDQIRLGGYLLRAELGSGSDTDTRAGALESPVPRTAAPPPRPAARRLEDPTLDPLSGFGPPPTPPTPPAGISSDNPFADLLGAAAPSPASPGRSDDPFADLLGSSTPPAPVPAPAAAPVRPTRAPADPFADLMGTPAGLDARSAAVAPTPPPAMRLPDDFDPFAPPPAAAPSRAAAPSPAPWSGPTLDDPLAGLAPAPAAPSLDQAFGLQAAPPGDDPLARFMADLAAVPPAPAQLPGAPGLPVDPLALFGDAPPPPAPVAPVQRNDLPAVHAAFRAPPVATATPPGSPAPRPLPPAAGGDGGAALWQAFCEGAGVSLPLPPGTEAERMRLLGQVMRHAVEGTLQLIAVRASTKNEMRAAVTQIQARSNNPLKFAPDAKVGIEQLVQPPMRGFLDGPAAMEDAMHDLVGHAIGTVAGMRAALEGMLDRFDPAALEAQLTRGSVLDSLLPMARKARLWELYLQHHRAIRDEAQDDFHAVFGKAFVAAYEQQVERLKNKAGGAA